MNRVSKENEKEQLIDSIERKKKFLGKRETFDRVALEAEDIEKLRFQDSMLNTAIRIRSPKMKAILGDKLKGRLDIRWEPFLQLLSRFARSKTTFMRRMVAFRFIDHLRNNDLLGNYISALFWVSIDAATDINNPNYSDFERQFKKLLKAADLEYLYTREPLAFSYDEDFSIKVVSQTAKNKDEADQFIKDARPILRWNASGAREPIPVPWMVGKMFGGKDRFLRLSLKTYGERSFEIIFNPKYKLF